MSPQDQAGNSNQFIVTFAWNALWIETDGDDQPNPYYLPTMILNGVTSNGVTVGPMQTLNIAQVPDVELLQSKNMSPLPFNSGSISISFSDLTISGFNTLSNGGLTYTADTSNPSLATISVALDASAFQASGQYAVLASGLAQCALDSAGALLTAIPAATSDTAVTPAAASDSSVTPVAPMSDMLDAARTQRTTLWQTPNGGALMDSFYQYNEVYNAFYSDTTSPLAVGWASSAVLSNANDTYAAIQNGSNVNSSAYNTTSFNQALSLYGACISASQHAGTDNNPLDGDTYTEAGNAVISFISTVSTTGNTISTTTVMTPANVYTAVTNGSGASPQVSAEELLGEREWEIVRSMQRKMDKHNRDRAATTAALDDSDTTIFNGACTVLFIGPMTLTLTTSADFSGSVPVVTVTAVSVTLPQPTLEINVAAWEQGTYANLGKQLLPAFESATFLRNYIHDLIVDQVESNTVSAYIQSAINNALSAALGPVPSQSST